MENGYHIYDFRGTLLREEHIDGFKQFVWRPRPATLLSKEEQAEIRKNLRNYSKMFDEQDLAKKNTANKAVVEARKRLLDEWLAWRRAVVEEVKEEEEEIGWKLPAAASADDGTAEEIEEIVEEIVEETEEVIG